MQVEEFHLVVKDLTTLIEKWEPKLSGLSDEVISLKRNSQNRTIKQIVGHMVDSASNNVHRMVHLQYRESPLEFPNYATNGNNDRWIAIQNYQEKDWNDLVQLWKYSNLHVVHVIKNIQKDKLNNEWVSAPEEMISLQTMVIDYLSHFQLHLDEIDALIEEKE